MKSRPNGKRSCSPILIPVLFLALCLGHTRISSALDEAKIHVAGTPNITSFVYQRKMLTETSATGQSSSPPSIRPWPP